VRGSQKERLVGPTKGVRFKKKKKIKNSWNCLARRDSKSNKERQTHAVASAPNIIESSKLYYRNWKKKSSSSDRTLRSHPVRENAPRFVPHTGGTRGTPGQKTGGGKIVQGKLFSPQGDVNGFTLGARVL